MAVKKYGSTASAEWLTRIMTLAFTNSEETFYIGLTCDGVEHVGDGYSRMPISFTAPTVKSASGNSAKVANTADITFPTSTAIWFPPDTQANGWALYDGSGSSATLLMTGVLQSPITVFASAAVTIPAGSLAISLGDYWVV